MTSAVVLFWIFRYEIMISTSILAGDFKGTRLKVGRIRRLRPTVSRIRGSIFNIVSDIRGATVLDLYAGVGTLGFEALSRGAISVTFIDYHREAVNLIRQNSFLFKNRDITVFMMDSMRFLRKTDKKFDVIFADPPYGTQNLSALKRLAWDHLAEEGTLVIESAVRDQWCEKNALIKRYGDTQISIFKKELQT